MIIGHGMIANVFNSYRNKEDIVIFASGVSDSTHAGPSAFLREKELLINTLKTNQNKLFVYFSTCSIYDPGLQDSAYVQHKKRIEEYIIANHTPYLVFRLTNPVGKTNNNNTLVNFFIKNILEKTEFEIWQNATRNIIDIDDMYLICNEIIQQKLFINQTINIANLKNYPVPFIVETIEKHLGVKGNYTISDQGNGPVIDSSLVQPLFQKFNITFDEHYLSEILQKYFPQ